jgi:hypothetical protein
LLVVLVEECSLESPLGELSVELDDDECSVVVAGAIGAGATTTTGGATSTGGGYTATAAGSGAEVVVSLVLFEVVVSVV